MKLVIKKTVNLGFLGEEYKDANLVFRSIPLEEYDKLMDDLPKSDPETTKLAQKVQSKEATPEEAERLNELLDKKGDDNRKSLQTIIKYLKKYFISGKFPDEEGTLQEVAADDLGGLDQDAAVHCFETLTGRANDPKEN